jgi:hypothetical protein
MIAVIEVGGLRKDVRFPHYLGDMSDYLDGLKAFLHVYPLKGGQRREALERYNIGFKRFQAASELLRDLSRRLEVEPSDDIKDKGECLRRCIVAGMLDHIFRPGDYGGESVLSVSKPGRYDIGNGSMVSHFDEDELCAGHLRVITPKDRRKPPFTILEKVTKFTIEDMKAVASVRLGILSEVDMERKPIFRGGTTYLYRQLRLFGEYVLKEELLRSWKEEVEPETQDEDPFSAIRALTSSSPSAPPVSVIPKPEPPKPAAASRELLEQLAKVGIGGKS